MTTLTRLVFVFKYAGATWTSKKFFLFFLFLNKIICCGYSLEAPQWGASNEYPQHMFLWWNKILTPYLELWRLLKNIFIPTGTFGEKNTTEIGVTRSACSTDAFQAAPTKSRNRGRRKLQKTGMPDFPWHILTVFDPQNHRLGPQMLGARVNMIHLILDLQFIYF